MKPVPGLGAKSSERWALRGTGATGTMRQFGGPQLSGVINGFRAPGRSQDGTTQATVWAHTQAWSLPLSCRLLRAPSWEAPGEARVQHPQHERLWHPVLRVPALSVDRVCQCCCHLNLSFSLSSIKERSLQQRLQQAEPEGHVFSAAAEMRSLQDAPSVLCRGGPASSKCHP